MGSHTKALWCQAEDSIPQKSLRTEVWHGWGKEGPAAKRTGCWGRGQVATSSECQNVGFGSGS